MEKLTDYENKIVEKARILAETGQRFAYTHIAYVYDNIENLLVDFAGIKDACELIQQCYKDGIKEFYDKKYIYRLNGYEKIEQIELANFKEELNFYVDEIEKYYKKLQARAYNKYKKIKESYKELQKI